MPYCPHCEAYLHEYDLIDDDDFEDEDHQPKCKDTLSKKLEEMCIDHFILNIVSLESIIEYIESNDLEEEILPMYQERILKVWHQKQLS